MISNPLRDKLMITPFLIMAHRGFWGGNIIENTIESGILAYRAGADIVEVDICRTADHQYYLFHDGNEPKVLCREENFKELTSEDINTSTVYNSIGSPSGHRLNTLAQFLDWLPKGKMINIDRSWEYWSDPAFFELIRRSGKQEQLIFKSPAVTEYLTHFSENGKGLAYIPIIFNTGEADLVLSYSELNTVGFELIIDHFNSDLLSEEWLKRIRQKDLVTVVNSENLGNEFNLLGGFHDDVALIENKSWDKIVDLGIGIIQTDWPNFLNEYRKNMKW